MRRRVAQRRRSASSLGVAAVALGRAMGGGAVSEDASSSRRYFGERDRAGDRFLADALRRRLRPPRAARPACVLRGDEGFGAKQHLRTDRLLTLSEDLPLVAVAVDARERDRGGAARRAARSRVDGLVTLERARLLDRPRRRAPAGCRGAKLTVYVGRQERAGGGRPSSPSSTCCTAAASPARRCCSASTAPRTASAGARASSARNAERAADGGRGGRRRRASPRRCRELAALLARPLVTLERVRVCKRDGSGWPTAALPGATRAAWRLAEAHGLRRRAGRHGGGRCTRARAPAARGRARRARRRCAASGATTATTRRTATASGRCAATCRSSRWSSTRPSASRALVRDRRRADRRDRAGDERDRADGASPSGGVG